MRVRPSPLHFKLSFPLVICIRGIHIAFHFHWYCQCIQPTLFSNSPPFLSISQFRITCSCFMKIDPTHTYHSSLIFSHVKSSISISISICIMHICPHFISIGRTIVLFTLHHSLAYVPVFVIGDTGLIIFYTYMHTQPHAHLISSLSRIVFFVLA